MKISSVYIYYKHGQAVLVQGVYGIRKNGCLNFRKWLQMMSILLNMVALIPLNIYLIFKNRLLSKMLPNYRKTVVLLTDQPINHLYRLKISVFRFCSVVSWARFKKFKIHSGYSKVPKGIRQILIGVMYPYDPHYCPCLVTTDWTLPN